MLRLIRSNLLRTYRNLVVWICVILQFCITFFYTLIDKSTNLLSSTSDTAFFAGFSILSLPLTGVLTVFACIIVLTDDFDNRAIVLKMQAGFSKHEIYMAGFFSSVIIGLTLYAVHLVVFCAISLPVLGKTALPTGYLAAVLTISLLSEVLYAAMSVFIVGICKKTLPSLAVALGVFVVTITLTFFVDLESESAFMIYDCVSPYSPKEAQEIADSAYGYLYSFNFKNTAKSEFFYNFFLAGNASKIFYRSPLNLWQIIPFAIAKISFLSGAGFIVAGRTDIK